MLGDELTLEGLTKDVKVTNEHLSQLEGAQIATEEKLKAIEDAQAASNTHLQDILARLDELRVASPVDNTAATRNSTGGPTASRAQRVAFGDPQIGRAHV